MENNVNPDQMALNLQCFLNQINLGPAGQGLRSQQDLGQVQ